MSILSFCPNNLCVELLTVSNSSLCPTPHCVQLIFVSNLSYGATCQVVQLVIVSNLYLCLTCHCDLPLRRFNLSLFLPFMGGGGGVQQQKRSCRRENSKMSLVFFVPFCSFTKHVQNRRFCVCPQKRTKRS